MPTAPSPGDPGTRQIVVADADPAAVANIIATLREDGHAVFHAYDALAANRLASLLGACDLVISNARVEGAVGVDLILDLRRRRPDLPILYMATRAYSTPELERQLPPEVPILREPFTAEKSRAAVGALLGRGKPGGGGGT